MEVDYFNISISKVPDTPQYITCVKPIMTFYNLFLQGIEWIHIEYFNNSVICDLIEKVSFWYNDNLGYFRWRKLNTI